MQKEIIREKTSSLCVNVSASAVDSLRKVVQNTTTVRVYENGFVGIAGQIGEVDLSDLENRAIANLENKVPYPCDLTSNVEKHIDERKDVVDQDSFVKVCQHLLQRLKTECPDFIFSNKIKYEEIDKYYENSCGTNLSYKGNSMSFTLVVKHKQTANIMDFAYFDEVDDYDENVVVENIKLLCDTFNKEASIDDGKYKVVSMSGEFLMNGINHFVGEMYANNASLFKGKLNERILSDKLAILKSKALNLPFFDDEGDLSNDKNAYIVKDGVFERVLANKKVSQQYSLPRIPCSSAAYDSTPAISGSGIELKQTANDLSEIIGDDKAILMIEASGGDMTSSGDFATPVQMSYLIENGKLVGKLPPLNATGNILDFLGKDYLGATKHSFLKTQSLQYVVANLNITKI